MSIETGKIELDKQALDDELTQALEDSFPGSDPISLTSPITHDGRPNPDTTKLDRPLSDSEPE